MGDTVIIAARRAAEDVRGPNVQGAKVWDLTDDHFEQVVEWRLAGLTLRQIVELCAQELALPPAKVPSRTGLSEFWQEYWPFFTAARRRENVRQAEALGEQITAQPFEVDGILRDQIKQAAFELLGNPNPPEKLVKAFLNAVLKMRDQEDRKEQRELDREKFAAGQRDKLQTAMAAFHERLKGSPAALKAYRDFERDVKELLAQPEKKK